MGDSDDSLTDRNIAWEVILIAFVAVVGGVAIVVELAWPGLARLSYPWGEPLLIAILWSSFFVIVCKRLLSKGKFWIALAAGILVQVWATKALIVNGVYLRRRATEGAVLLGIIVWGIAYLLLTWIGMSRSREESASGRDDDELL